MAAAPAPAPVASSAPAGSAPVGAGLLVLAVAALLLLAPLGRHVIATSHEARFAVLAQDVLAHGTWTGPRVGGEVYRNKPPLHVWSIVGLSRARGRVTAATAQAPSALAAVGAVGATFLLGGQLFGGAAALAAGLVLLTSYGFFAHSQLVLPDMAMVFWSIVAVSFFWRAVSGPPAAWPMVASYAATALAVATKGPAGLLPILVGAAWLWSDAGARGLRRLWSPAGLVVFTLVTLAWLVPFLRHGVGSFATDVLWRDWVRWFVGVPSPSALGAFAVEALAGFLPWTLVLPVAAHAAMRDRRAPAVRFALLWLAVVVVLIALSGHPRSRYLLPAQPAAALLVAWWASRAEAPVTALARALGWLALGATAAGLGALVWHLLGSGAPGGVSLPLVVIAAGAGAATGLALFAGLGQGRAALFVPVAAVAAALALGAGTWAYVGWESQTHAFPQAAAALARHAAATGAPAAAFLNRHFFQMDFYGGELRQIRTVQEFNAHVSRPERPVILVNSGNWTFIAPHRVPGLAVLDRIPVGDEDLLIVRRGPPLTP